MRIPLSMALLGLAMSMSACGTAYRYEYHDYGEKTIDEKNDQREEKMWRNSGGRMPSSSRARWRR
jgi:hypothetical protein